MYIDVIMPSPPLNGVIKGFYGRPWTFEQRLELSSPMKAWGLNTIMDYAARRSSSPPPRSFRVFKRASITCVASFVARLRRLLPLEEM